ncbi:MAG: hypothetical protein OXF20_11995 [Gammaproteobacteria bacterium]|nr:hypothetical protein [Gammaproteobacteria bacterium]
MFESTNVQHDLSNQAVGEGRLPREVVFPSVRARQDQESNGRITANINGRLPRRIVLPSTNVAVKGLYQTYRDPDLQNGINHELTSEIYQARSFAHGNFQDLDRNRLEQAICEALILANSGLFDSEIYPDVRVDPYGEITFSHKSSAGYVDIGVRGERELSYHVRNDIEPMNSKFDDHRWDYNCLPQPLCDAIRALKQNLL